PRSKKRNLERRLDFLEAMREFHVLSVVDRAVDDRYRVVLQRSPERWNEVRGPLDAIAFGAKTFRIFHEVWVLECDMAWTTEMAELVPCDKAVFRISPDQDNKRSLHPHCCLNLLRVHHEAGVTGHRYYLAIGIRQLSGNRSRHSDPHGRESVGNDARVGALGLVHARDPHLVRTDVRNDNVVSGEHFAEVPHDLLW